MKKNILVVANLTAASPELGLHLAKCAQREPTTFTLLMPAKGAGDSPETAAQQLQAAVTSLRADGLEVDGTLGDRDPIIAVSEAWDPRRYDEIVISTLPIGSSKWLHAGLPERVFKLTGALVTHVVSAPPKPPVEHVPPPRHDEKGLGPLTVLGWGGRHDRPAPATRS